MSLEGWLAALPSGVTRASLLDLERTSRKRRRAKVIVMMPSCLGTATGRPRANAPREPLRTKCARAFGSHEVQNAITEDTLDRSLGRDRQLPARQRPARTPRQRQSFDAPRAFRSAERQECWRQRRRIHRTPPPHLFLYLKSPRANRYFRASVLPSTSPIGRTDESVRPAGMSLRGNGRKRNFDEVVIRPSGDEQQGSGHHGSAENTAATVWKGFLPYPKG